MDGLMCYIGLRRQQRIGGSSDYWPLNPPLAGNRYETYNTIHINIRIHHLLKQARNKLETDVTGNWRSYI